ncbi:MAG TPA: hypothetical protein PK299_13575, partial [Anaerolineales bacterium]|nr:hypothetical protein [Anaerolineales bacterium]
REFLETLFDTADSAEPAPVEDELILPAVAELPSEALAEIPNLPAETRLADDIEVNDLAFLLEEPHAETPTANAGNDSGETLNISEQQTKPLAGLEEFPVLPTPDWEAIEAHANQQAKETPDWLSNVVSAPEENALVDDIEWLPELSESQELRATATNLQGTDRHVVANEPDWLSSAKEALLPDAKNLEIPDWLHEAMASGENTPEDSLNPLADISATPATEEIPDWLQNVTKVADADEPSAKLDTALEKTFQKVSIPSEPIINEAISELEAPLEPEPDWLKPTFTESQSVDALQASPDWLPAEPMPLDSDKIEAELADIEPPTSTLNDGMEGWLNDLLPEEAENQPVQDEIPAVKPANRPHQVSPAERIDNFDEWLKNAIGVGEDTQGQPAVERAETPESAVMAELNQLSANSAPAEEASTEPAPIDDWFMRLPEAMGVEVETPMASESPVTAEAPTLPEAQLVPEVAETVEVSAVAEISAPSLPSDEVKPQENIESHLREHAMLPQVDAWKPKTANLPADHLAQARESLLDGLIPQAIQRYGKLVRGGKLIPSVIEDLQVAVKEQPRRHRAELYQVLGDALSKAERLDEALEAYKQALQQL